MTRVVTSQEVMKYYPLVQKFIRDSVVRNWTETNQYMSEDEEMILGNTSMSLADFRQYLLSEVVVALQKYDPNYRTRDGKSVQELSFVHTHLSNRIGGLLKKLTKTRQGYGIWKTDIDEIIGDRRESE